MAFSIGETLVFDLTSHLDAIDNFYQGYDQIMNTIKMIEQQYQQIQMAIESAKNLDWKNISWDGDLDFRNEIKNATSQVDRILKRTQKIQSIFTNKKMTCGGVSYSMMDLVGQGNENKNIFTAFKDGSNAVLASLKNAANSFSKEMTDDEKKTLWKKYGLSPQNYFYTQTLKDNMKESITKIIEEGHQEAQNLRIEEKTVRKNEIIKSIVEGDGSEQNAIQIEQKNALLTGELIDGIGELQSSVENVAGTLAWKTRLEEQEKEIENEAEEQIRKDTKRNNLNRGFGALIDNDY